MQIFAETLLKSIRKAPLIPIKIFGSSILFWLVIFGIYEDFYDLLFRDIYRQSTWVLFFVNSFFAFPMAIFLGWFRSFNIIIRFTLFGILQFLFLYIFNDSHPKADEMFLWVNGFVASAIVWRKWYIFNYYYDGFNFEKGLQFNINHNVDENILVGENEGQKWLEDLPEKNRSALIISLNKRADELLNKSEVVLRIVISVLIFSALFIVFAGWISELGVTRTDALADAKAERVELADELLTVETEQRRTVANLVGALSSLESNGIASNFENLFNGSEDQSDEENGEKIKELIVAIDDIKTNLKQIDTGEFVDSNFYQLQNSYYEKVANSIPELRNKIVDQQSRSSDVTDANLLIAAGVTRFGVLLITIYLVQILVNLYRYNTRLAGFYRSHADALTLMDHKHTQIRNLQGLLEPNLDYGRGPRSIPERLADTLASGAAKLRKGDGNKTPNATPNGD